MELISLLVLLALIARACATPFPSTSHTVPGLESRPDIQIAETSAHNIAPVWKHKRDGRAKCDISIGDVAGFELELAALTSNMTLRARTMTLPGNNIERFMKAETNSQSPAVRQVVWTQPPDEDDFATASFEELKDEALSYAVQGLCGCTTLFIISRRAVYASHYWESISFDPDEQWLEHFKGDPEKAFQQTVIKGLTEGVQKKGENQQVSLKNYANKIDDPSLRAYLIIPSNAAATEDPSGYRDKWDRLKAKVNEFLPRLNQDNKNEGWTEVRYDVLDMGINAERRLLFTTARGRALFKYDPDHHGKKKTMLWVEANANAYHDDEW